MYLRTKALVVHSIKYRDSDLIVKCLTEYGIESYLLKGGASNKKATLKSAFFQPLSQLEMVTSHRGKNTLEYIKEARIIYAYQSLYTNPIKNLILFYIAELISKSIREKESDSKLLEFVMTSLQWFDNQDKVANFHLVFSCIFTKYLGFFPGKSLLKDSRYFDLKEGISTRSRNENCLYGDDLKLFKELFSANFENIDTIKLTREKRRHLLNLIINYYEHHLDNFGPLNSLSILQKLSE